MANYNKVILAGNLTRDPQLSYLPNQTPVVELGLAINRRWKGQDGQQQKGGEREAPTSSQELKRMEQQEVYLHATIPPRRQVLTLDETPKLARMETPKAEG